jgi:hypothetical protein
MKLFPLFFSMLLSLSAQAGDGANIYCAGGWFMRASDIGLECYYDLVTDQGRYNCFVGDIEDAAGLLREAHFGRPYPETTRLRRVRADLTKDMLVYGYAGKLGEFEATIRRCNLRR